MKALQHIYGVGKSTVYEAIKGRRIDDTKDDTKEETTEK